MIFVMNKIAAVLMTNVVTTYCVRSNFERPIYMLGINQSII